MSRDFLLRLPRPSVCVVPCPFRFFLRTPRGLQPGLAFRALLLTDVPCARGSVFLRHRFLHHVPAGSQTCPAGPSSEYPPRILPSLISPLPSPATGQGKFPIQRVCQSRAGAGGFFSPLSLIVISDSPCPSPIKRLSPSDPR